VIDMREHRWRDISTGTLGPADDPDWPTGRTLPTFGDGSAASLEAGEILPLAPLRSTLVVWFEVYDGQGAGAAPVSPTPDVIITMEVIAAHKDAAGQTVFARDPVAVVGVQPQRRTIGVELEAQGLHFVRITSIAGTGVPDPGSIRLFVSQETMT
jgi:hypothetical protein